VLLTNINIVYDCSPKKGHDKIVICTISSKYFLYCSNFVKISGTIFNIQIFAFACIKVHIDEYNVTTGIRNTKSFTDFNTKNFKQLKL
jgi:hypothetical protein